MYTDDVISREYRVVRIIVSSDVRITPQNPVKMSGLRGPVSCRRRHCGESKDTTVCVCTMALAEGRCFYDPNCVLVGGVERPVPCVNRLRTACTRGRLPSAYRKNYSPGEKDSIWTTSLYYCLRRKNAYARVGHVSYSHRIISILNMYGREKIIP